jgi:hypothetical protein
LAFPPPLQQSIAKKFNSSVHGRYLISYRPPHSVINEYGYAVKLVDQVPTRMTVSRETHTCYFYKRTNKPATPKPSDITIVLPARTEFESKGEVDEEVVCDPCFKDAVLLAVGSMNPLKRQVDQLYLNHRDQPGEKRVREQVVRYQPTVGGSVPVRAKKNKKKLKSKK